MTDKPVPPPALSSEALDKSRRNTLVWSALVVASELAQTTKHQIKSSAIGSDMALPVSMVSMIFLLLAAFHLYAFWVEKKRIVRWRSKYAMEHPGVSLRGKITALYDQLPGLLLKVSENNSAAIDGLGKFNGVVGKINQQYIAVEYYYKAIIERDKQLAEAVKASGNVDDSDYQAVLAKFYYVKDRPFSPDFELIWREAGHLRMLLERDTGPTMSFKQSSTR